MKHLILAVFSFVSLVLSAESTAADDAKTNRPNTVVIFIDDMGFADPSCFGNPLIKTPHIDKLAAEGIKLTNFYVNSPICSPASKTQTAS